MLGDPTMRGVQIMRLVMLAILILSVAIGCAHGDALHDGPEISLCVSVLWNGEPAPVGSTAAIDFYVMREGTGSWELVSRDEPFPIMTETAALADTMFFDYDVPEDGGRVTFRYEVELTVDGEIYSPADYPELVCESGVWWWYFRGSIECSERER
jgi:hypothetical protein